jgi:hypothetical protein
MKVFIAATAAMALLAGAALAADTKASPDAGKSTNSDGSPGKNANQQGTTIDQTKNSGSNPSEAGKSTNSDGSSGATGGGAAK